MSKYQDAPEQRADGNRDAPGVEADEGLPREIQEQLGRKLRVAYSELADKPAFLGDTRLPTELEALSQRLSRHDEARAAGAGCRSGLGYGGRGAA